MANQSIYKSKLGCFRKISARSSGYDLLFSKDRKLFGRGVHIVIASEDCGDIRLLKDAGVPNKQIVACDLLPAARIAAKKLGVVISPYGDIRQTVAWVQLQGLEIASINVDLCCALGKGLDILVPILTAGVNTMFTFCIRDGAVAKKWPALSKAEARMAEIASRTGLIPDDMFQYRSTTLNNMGGQMCRAVFFTSKKRHKNGISPIQLAAGVEVALQAKKYKCNRCGMKNAGHPASHKQNCFRRKLLLAMKGRA